MTRTLFHSLTYDDIDRAIAFLTAVGFTEAAVYRDDKDPSIVNHAQFNWRDSGGVMFGSNRNRTEGWTDSVGHGHCYCVVETDDEVDRIHAAAVAAGGRSIREPATPDYGGRECGVADPEGNLWSFGTYAGE